MKLTVLPNMAVLHPASGGKAGNRNRFNTPGYLLIVRWQNAIDRFLIKARQEITNRESTPTNANGSGLSRPVLRSSITESGGNDALVTLAFGNILP